MTLKFNKGEKFNKLTVIEFSHRDNHGKYQWLCQCDCGNTTTVVSSRIKSGHTTSCGCHKTEIINSGLFKSHGLSNTKVHYAWKAFRQRCSNEHLPNYENYGGRDITYDLRWDSFEEFYKDMGEPPSSKHSLDRIDNNKGYSKENCRWTDRITQNTNRRNTIHISFGGTVLPLWDICQLLNFPYKVAYNRRRAGWLDENLFLPKLR